IMISTKDNRGARRKKEKQTPKVVYCYNEAENAYYKEETIKSDLWEYITDAPAIESPISNLFDYYYKERQDLYKIRSLKSMQHFQLQQFLVNNLDLFT
ncbi:13158_t:CDS:1, partial [Racocetra persica]